MQEFLSLVPTRFDVSNPAWSRSLFAPGCALVLPLAASSFEQRDEIGNQVAVTC
jgi:hypothetical protein